MRAVIVVRIEARKNDTRRDAMRIGTIGEFKEERKNDGPIRTDPSQQHSEH